MNPVEQIGVSAPGSLGMVDVDAEVTWWRSFYAHTTPSLNFLDYEPAVRLGIQACLHAHGRGFDEVDTELGASYELVRRESGPDWRSAKAFAQASWERIEHSAMGLG